nr:hypothetical protein [Nanoarchaeota archaeon]
MSLKKSNTLLIAFSVLLLLIASTSLLFPGITDNIITGLAGIASFPVSLSVIHITFDIDNREQLDNVVVNGTNITIKMPVNYSDNITINLTTDKPEGFECGFDWYINESGNIKNVSVNDTELSWEADKAIKDTDIYFEVSPPTITSEVVYTGDSYYEKTMVIDSCAPLINVSVNVSVSTNYEDYILYLIENNTQINKTAEYHLQVSNGTAFFYGFNLTSNMTFRLRATPDVTLVERVVRIGGVGGVIPLLNYTPTKQFFVDPNYISITTKTLGLLEAYITIYNLRGTEKEFNISYTTNFVYDVISSIIIPHKDSAEIPIYINTTTLEPGKYTDYVYVRTNGDEEKVTIDLELVEVEEEVEEEKLPEEEQPRPIPVVEEEEIKEKKINMLVIILLMIGLFLITFFVLLHLEESKPKQ